MIAESQASGTALIFTNLKIGDGELADGEDIKALTSAKNPMLTAPIQSYKNQGDGQVKVRFVVSNASLSIGFFARELGIYAKLGDNGAEQLYAYTNAGNLADYISDKSTPIDEQIIDIYIVVANASGVTVVTDTSVYMTKLDIQEHNADVNAHSALITILKTQIENGGMNILKRDKTYIVGDIAYSANLASWMRLECVVGGKTALVEPTWGTTVGVYVGDGAAVWITADVRDGLSVGGIDYLHILKAGRIKANGALISRTTYPRLYKYATDNNLFTTEALWVSGGYSGLFGVGDGSTTFRVPDLRGRFLEGADTAGAGIEAGLPNITGRYVDLGFDVSATGTGAMYNAGGWGERAEHNGRTGGQTSIGFNASLSNAIYGKSTTVQPPAITMIPQIKY